MNIIGLREMNINTNNYIKTPRNIVSNSY